MWDILQNLIAGRNAFKKRKLTLDGKSWSSPSLYQALALLPWWELHWFIPESGPSARAWLFPFALCKPKMFGKCKRVVQTLGIIVIHLKGHISTDKCSQTGGLLVPHIAELAKNWGLEPPQSQGCPGTGVVPRVHWGCCCYFQLPRDSREWSGSREMPRGRYTEHNPQPL